MEDNTNLTAICVRGSNPADWLICGNHFEQSHLTRYEGVGVFLLNFAGTLIVKRLTFFLSSQPNLKESGTIALLIYNFYRGSWSNICNLKIILSTTDTTEYTATPKQYIDCQ